MYLNVERKDIGIACVEPNKHEVRIRFAKETGFRHKKPQSYADCMKLVDFIQEKGYINTLAWYRKDFPSPGWEWEGNEEPSPSYSGSSAEELLFA